MPTTPGDMLNKSPEEDDGIEAKDWFKLIIETDHHSELGRIAEAVGELTSATVDAKIKGLLTPDIASALYRFMHGMQKSLEDMM